MLKGISTIMNGLDRAFDHWALRLLNGKTDEDQFSILRLAFVTVIVTIMLGILMVILCIVIPIKSNIIVIVGTLIWGILFFTVLFLTAALLRKVGSH